MLWLPAKSTSTQSGKLPGVASTHPPPFPQFTPARSPLITLAAANPVPYVDDALATAPADASATFVPLGGADTVSSYASISVTRLYPSTAPVTSTRILCV